MNQPVVLSSWMPSLQHGEASMFGVHKLLSILLDQPKWTKTPLEASVLMSPGELPACATHPYCATQQGVNTTRR